MALRLITAPAESPVTLAEAKAHLAVTHSLDDTLIQLYIDAATSHLDGAEGTLGRCLVTQTWEWVADSFPASPIRLPLPPLQSVTSVSYVDADGNTQVVDSSGYVVDSANQPGWVVPVSGWPATGTTPNAAIVRFVAGYGDAADVPAAIKAAILLYVGDAYANREAAGEALVENPAALRLTRPFKVFRA